jgi:hypothetical protein
VAAYLSLVASQLERVIHAETEFYSCIRVWCVFEIDLMKILMLAALIYRAGRPIYSRLLFLSPRLGPKIVLVFSSGFAVWFTSTRTYRSFSLSHLLWTWIYYLNPNLPFQAMAYREGLPLVHVGGSTDTLRVGGRGRSGPTHMWWSPLKKITF